MGSKDAINLFLKKEFSELRGRRNFNLWVLAGVFFVSILVIGFGSASMSYLSYKMKDPFINWVDINLDQDKESCIGKEDVQTYLQKKETQDHFMFVDPQPNYVDYQFFFKKDNSSAKQYDGRSIAATGLDNEGNKVSNPILDRILEKGNVIVNRNNIPLYDNELGIIITEKMAFDLGYTEPPAFVAMSWSQDPEMSEIVKLEGGKNGKYPVYIPVVAVVKQLPGMNDWLFTNRYWGERNAGYRFCLWLDENNKELLLCGEEDYLKSMKEKVENEGFEAKIESYLGSWKDLSCLKIVGSGYGEELTKSYNELMASVQPNMSKCTRIYDFRKTLNEDGGRTQYYSIRMLKLDSVKAFANDIQDKCGLKLEMTNVDAKDNFNFVQRMGMVLSGSIIIIVALFILVFIYFMLQSHFQKIQRNLGTFKAFGVDNSTLDMIYVRLILRVVGIAFVIGAVLATLVAEGMALCRFRIEPAYMWVNVFTWWNMLLLFLAVIAAIAATILVSQRMLKKTPGDLIYDRA